MSKLVHYTSCPVCGAAQFENVFPVRDYTVSKQEFMIVMCRNCTLRITQDVPDQESIAPYYNSQDYISHSNTSRGLTNKIYQSVRKKTVRHKRRLVQRLTGLKKGRLLELGSGTGTFAAEMKRHGWDVVGLEPDPSARELAKKLYDIGLNDMNALENLEPGSFDAITLWHVLEHVHDLHQMLEKLKSLIKKDGQIFIAVPNYTSKDGSIYKEYWAGYDVPRHLYHFSPQSMKLLLEKHQLKLISNKPMWFDSFYISLLSNKYKYGRSRPVSAFLNGLRSNFKAMGDKMKCSSVIYVAGR